MAPRTRDCFNVARNDVEHLLDTNNQAAARAEAKVSGQVKLHYLEDSRHARGVDELVVARQIRPIEAGLFRRSEVRVTLHSASRKQRTKKERTMSNAHRPLLGYSSSDHGT